MIEVNKLTFTYAKNAHSVIQEFSAIFNKGEITAVTGKNGCGKTTLSKLMTGILQPDSGSIYIDGEDISGMNLFAVGQRIGYIWQNPNRQLFCPTVAEEIAFGLHNKGLSDMDISSETDRYLEMFRLTAKKTAHPLLLSLGEKQRLALAAVLSLGAPYLLLDEPTGGLDVRCRRLLGAELQQLAERQNCGVIVISHEDDFLRRFCAKKVVM